MTDSDSSVVEVDSRGSRKSSGRKHGSSGQSRNPVKKHGSSSTVSNKIDCDSIVFLSSPALVSAVTSKFDARKKNIVESLGFEGLLHLPDTSSLDNGFSLWLMRNMKWLSGAICLGETPIITLSLENVGKVIGLNYSGIDVSEKALVSSPEKSAYFKSRLSFLHTESDIVQAAESFVQADWPEKISQTHIDNFKVAFVIFVMGRFLAPGEHYVEGNYDFWGALVELEAISCYNWGKYVLSNMLESVRKVNWDIVYNRKIKPVTCCTLIIQIFYLDNIDFGSYNRAHTVFPRVKHYSCELMSRLIDCDKIISDDLSSPPSYGRIKTVRSCNTCYKPGTDPVITIDPVVFSPSPQFYPTSRSASPKETRKRTVQYTSSPNPCPSSEGIPTPIDNVASVGIDTIDIPSFLREHYNGQCPAELLEAMSLHQAKCFQHVESFSKALKAALSKENANFAIRVIEHASLNPGILAGGNTHSPLPVRQIQYNDTPLRTPLRPGTSFQDNLKLKMPRTDISQPGKAPQSSLGKDCTSRSASLPLAQNSFSSQKHGQSASTSITATTSLYKGTESSKPTYKYESPEPYKKLFGTPQEFSPTTENKIFNGISLSARQVNSMQSIDLNATSFAAEYSSSPVPKKFAQIGPIARSHWSLGLDAMSPGPSTCSGLFNWLANSPTKAELDRYWIMHDSPRFIQIEGHQLRMEFVCNSPMSFSVFDLITRRLKQVDRSIYSSTRPLRWRHLFESDFSMHALGDDHPHENIAVRDQFVGADVDYDLCRCRMIFVPVLSNDIWFAYVFDTETSSVVIMDPSGVEMDGTLIQRHSGTIATIKHHLSVSIRNLFSGWNPKFEHFKTVVFRYTGMPCRRYQTGFFTLFFMANFDGACLVSEPSQVNMQKFKELVLYEILDLEGNTARTPSPYINLLD